MATNLNSGLGYIEMELLVILQSRPVKMPGHCKAMPGGVGGKENQQVYNRFPR